jgi:hypothetical protein
MICHLVAMFTLLTTNTNGRGLDTRPPEMRRLKLFPLSADLPGDVRTLDPVLGSSERVPPIPRLAALSLNTLLQGGI